ncbi:MAG TPA: ribonuclease III [Candidatus Peribacterales bacterium]|nr:ribonuclease III [Candidatus Peribacterales bacterium]
MSATPDLTALEKTIGVKFRNKELLLQALTHRSAVRGENRSKSYERLEFLGDAVLELAVTEFLYAISSKPEGELTNWRSALVKGETLATIAREIQVGNYLIMSRGEDTSGGREKSSTLADVVEALIGAMYLDQGFDPTRIFIDTFILSKLRELLAKGEDRDAKSVFQENAQDKLGITPTYQVLEEIGPDHDKTFTIGVFIGEEKIAEGTGPSKQKAEQDAAEKGLKKKKWGRK